LVGLGGTATVYRATDDLLGRTVAVKVFAPHLTDPVMLTRQRQEMRVVRVCSIRIWSRSTTHGWQTPLAPRSTAVLRISSWSSWTGRASPNGSAMTVR